MSKLCPECNHLLRENSYFGKLICDNCEHVESIKNNMWIEELNDIIEYNSTEIDIVRKPNNIEIANKINEIIRVLNKITNPRVNEI